MLLFCFIIVVNEKRNVECMNLFALLGSGESGLMYTLRLGYCGVPVIQFLSTSQNYSYSLQTCSLDGIDLRSVTFECVLVGKAYLFFQWNMSEKCDI